MKQLVIAWSSVVFVVVLVRGVMYMFAMWRGFVGERWTLMIWSSMLVLDKVGGGFSSVKARSVLTKVMSPPPLSRSRSCLMVVYPCMMGVLCLFVSLVSCMVSTAMFSVCAICVSSTILFLMLFVLHWSMLSFVRLWEELLVFFVCGSGVSGGSVCGLFVCGSGVSGGSVCGCC